MEEGTYDTAQICLNGHRVTSSYHRLPQHRQDFCDRCGQPTIYQCPSCQTEIRGHYSSRGVIVVQEPPVPAFCYACGLPYPWTQSALEAARELIADDEQLTEEERDQLSGSLDDLVTDSPRTQVAAGRFKRLIQKATAGTANGLRDILVDIAAETAKRAIWGGP